MTATETQVLVWLAGAGAVASVGVMVWRNRVKINMALDAIFGPRRAADGGLEAEHESLAETLDEVRENQRRAKRERAAEHSEVRKDLGRVQDAIAELAEELDGVDADAVVPELDDE